MARRPSGPSKTTGRLKKVVALVHDEASRKNIPTAEMESVAHRLEETDPIAPVRYARQRPLAEGATRERDGDLDPQIVWNGARITLTEAQRRQLQETGEVEIGDAQLVWRGKDQQDWSDLVVQAPQLFVQEKVHPKAIIDDLKRRSGTPKDDAPDLFADFNGLDPEARTEFYQHEGQWTNRMILGDSLQVMASLAEREALRGKVQCIYFDPPYGIKFNSNWQVSTQSRDVKDGKQTDISREPEQVKAFRDTWKDGIHSYLTYLRDRLSVARELLSESGSILLQISNENVHLVRCVLDEVFGSNNCVSTISLRKSAPETKTIKNASNYLLWYARNVDLVKTRKLYRERRITDGSTEDPRKLPLWALLADGSELPLTTEEKREELPLPPSSTVYRVATVRDAGSIDGRVFDIHFRGESISPGRKNCWRGTYDEMSRLITAGRISRTPESLGYKLFISDSWGVERTNIWEDTSGNNPDMRYIVETNAKIIARSILLCTDPGDLVLDPTCGSGTTPFVAEQWGRRWITIDTSRVALALARTRLMSARYAYYLLADSPEGRRKEQEESGQPQPLAAAQGDIRQGFVYERAPHVTLKSITNNAEIDVIYERCQALLEPLRAALNATHGGAPYEDWQIPREAGAGWPVEAKDAHAKWWEGRIARQREIDASIAKAADVELLYDRPYEDKTRVRVAGPFTVESLSPHRVVPADAAALFDEADELLGDKRAPRAASGATPTDFAGMILDNLRAAGVSSKDKADKIDFTSLTPWPGARGICAEGRFMEGDGEAAVERRAAIFLGPEFGTLGRSDLVAAAREATEARFDVLIACAFAYDAHASEFTRLGPLPILKAKMNPDLHMAGELKTNGKGNLFVVFGEPDIEIETVGGDMLRVKVKGIDVFDPNTGEIRSDDTDGIAAWFIDTDYDEESFFVRHAYFLGANDPYKSLKTALRAEIDEAAWATLYRDESRPFARPSTGRIAVKVINHFGDEVMKVFRI